MTLSLKPTIMKFGGTCVEDAAAFERVVKIVRTHRDSPCVVVVSAMSGVTDALLNTIARAESNSTAPGQLLDHLKPHFERHRLVAQRLVGQSDSITTLLESAQREIASLLADISEEEMPVPLLQDLVVSYGERLSAPLLTEVFTQAGLLARYIDSRRCIITDGEHGRAEPLLEQTASRTRSKLEPLLNEGVIPILGGFIASTSDGTTTTLGRGGSDYTAALVGAALGASEVQIWTDVPGVLTADPRVLPQARTIPRLSYGEAAELAYFGAKVLHPKSIQPAVEQNIPVRICNARTPDQEGTIVGSETEVSPQAVKAIAHKTGITLVQITSARMLGAHGFLHAIFEIFNRYRTVIDIVTTSEVSVSLSVDDDRALPSITDELSRLGEVSIQRGCAIICVVGEGIRGTPGVAARVFGSLNDINISLISQGASRINLTFVVDQENAVEAISRLHHTFFENEVAPVSEGMRA
jgi:aspartate kinase